LRVVFSFLFKPNTGDSGEKEQARLNPNVANVGGLQIQGVKDDVVVLYFEPLTTQKLKSSGVPDG
jgi:hypothetical protein